MWKQPSGGSPTYYFYDDGPIPACEFNDSGAITQFHTSGVNGLLCSTAKSGSSWAPTYYAFDWRGNTVNLFDGSGTVYANTTYKAYNGRNADHTYNGARYEGFGGQFGYCKDFDEGLYLLGQRYYSPQEGRFLSRDPIGQAGGLNVYSYAGNNPINNVDPSGLADVEIRFNKISLLGYHHAYIVVRDLDGTEYIVRSGPSGNSKNIFSASGGSSSQGSRGASTTSCPSSSSASNSSNGSSNSSNGSSPGSSRGGRGRNKGPWGRIYASYGYDQPFMDAAGTKRNPDYVEQADSSVSVIHDNQPASYYYNRLTAAADKLNAGWVPYNPISTNSNATAYDLLKTIGLRPPSPKVWAPGWDTALPYRH